jgi:two-component system, cell cycle sensor histidine kinase and response regulator CckA
MKVLVADDDTASRHLICALLEKQGYETIQADNGVTALQQLLAEDAPKLAIIDWIMPGLDGIEVCRRLRAQMSRHYTYLLLVTSRSTRSDLLAALEAGADDYLSKPFDYSELQVRLRVGQRIIQAETRLQQAQRIEAIVLLAGGIAHDFNNIAMIISSYCELLLDRVQDSALRLKVEQIQKAGQRAASLTQQLLAFSRQQVIAPVVCNVNSVIDELSAKLQRLLGKQVDCNISLAPELWPVKADAGQIERVLFNLATNSRDAMPQGGSLTITTRNVELDDSFVQAHLGCNPGPYVMFSVEDTGCAMTKEVQSHVFEPFFTTKEKVEGAGMGLASVYGTVKQSGGYVTVESDFGKGTTFAVYLPRCDERESTSVCSEIKPKAAQGQVVLVVEDEDSTREAICSYLNGNGYQALGAATAEEALAAYKLAPSPPSLVLTDVLMPGTTGPELAKHILELNAKAKVIFMSGHADCFSAGDMDGMAGFRFLQKPFPLSALLTAIGEYASAV